MARVCCLRAGLLPLQDIFDAGLVLGDTDYRQLSYKDRGSLPGACLGGADGVHVCACTHKDVAAAIQLHHAAILLSKSHPEASS